MLTASHGILVFASPAEIVVGKFDGLQSVYLCLAIRFADWLGLAVSALSLTFLNIDKIVLFRWPFFYSSFWKKYAMTAFAISLILAFG